MCIPKRRKRRERTRTRFGYMKLIPTYPCRDLDGTSHPGCEHQHQTKDAVELAVIVGIGQAIIAAGYPKPIARAGEIVDTTWCCERNKKKKTRRAYIYSVSVGMVRHPQSMFYRPQLEFLAWHLDGDNNPIRLSGGMVLTDFNCLNGDWKIAEGERIHPRFNLEWISPITGKLQSIPGKGVVII